MKLIYHSPVKPREFSRTQLCKDPRWCEKNVMGSGPFTFAEYQLGQSIKGVRNPDYYRQDTRRGTRTTPRYSPVSTPFGRRRVARTGGNAVKGLWPFSQDP